VSASAARWYQAKLVKGVPFVAHHETILPVRALGAFKGRNRFGAPIRKSTEIDTGAHCNVPTDPRFGRLGRQEAAKRPQPLWR
jgi:hypothetical protein